MGRFVPVDPAVRMVPNLVGGQAGNLSPANVSTAKMGFIDVLLKQQPTPLGDNLFQYSSLKIAGTGVTFFYYPQEAMSGFGFFMPRTLIKFNAPFLVPGSPTANFNVHNQTTIDPDAIPLSMVGGVSQGQSNMTGHFSFTDSVNPILTIEGIPFTEIFIACNNVGLTPQQIHFNNRTQRFGVLTFISDATSVKITRG